MLRIVRSLRPLMVMLLALQALTSVRAEDLRSKHTAELPANPLRSIGRDQSDLTDLRSSPIERLPDPLEPDLNDPGFRTKISAAELASEALAPEELPLGEPSPFRLPSVFGESIGGDFPSLPPDPYEDQKPPLPPLEDELWYHGGAHLYESEGDHRNWSEHDDHHGEILRLPETWQKPKPLTAFQQFLGADPIHDRPRLHWPGKSGYVWEPRFVGYGRYDLFAFAIEENNNRRDAIGQQLIVDLDLRLTGTERFHVQFRPLGEKNTGGSFYQFSKPEGYIDNSTARPERYWFEAELHSLLGSFVNPSAVVDYHIIAGRFPFALQNNLLINDEILGVVINKNNIYAGPLSNLNVQLFYGFNDVDSFHGSDSKLYGMNAAADYHNEFWEAMYAFVQNDVDSTRDAHYAAGSRTKMFGPTTIALRAMFKWGDEGGSGNGHLFVAESNHTRVFDTKPLGIEKGVFYCNTFLATEGWNSIAGGNFNRLTTSFEVDPLVQIAAGRPADDTWGASVGVQLFRRHEDESLIPEFAFQSPDNEAVWGFGLRYLRKTGKRSFFEAMGVFNNSKDPRFEREGVFVSESILF